MRMGKHNVIVISVAKYDPEYSNCATMSINSVPLQRNDLQLILVKTFQVRKVLGFPVLAIDSIEYLAYIV